MNLRLFLITVCITDFVLLNLGEIFHVPMNAAVDLCVAWRCY